MAWVTNKDINLKDMNFNQAVDYVRKHFVPRWDKKRQWVIKEVSFKEAEYSDGWCKKKDKTILISMFKERGLSLLIHEIAHAVSTGKAHGEKWQIRMERAATKARELGHIDIANQIIADVEDFKTTIEILEANHEVYSLIEDYVGDFPECEFKEAVEYVCRFLYIQEEDFYKRFNMAEKVFKRFKKQWAK